jgi:RimJ/RimL family protein N-acetyltransferase
VTPVPQLNTERLLLRGFEASDLDAYAAMMADPEVTRYLGDPHPLSRADAWRQLAMFAGHWVLRGFGVWAVEERATGTFIGRIGCWEPEGWPGFELAYTLARPAWGRGYAREGGAAAVPDRTIEFFGSQAVIYRYPDPTAPRAGRSSASGQTAPRIR